MQKDHVDDIVGNQVITALIPFDSFFQICTELSFPVFTNGVKCN